MKGRKKIKKGTKGKVRNQGKANQPALQDIMTAKLQAVRSIMVKEDLVRIEASLLLIDGDGCPHFAILDHLPVEDVYRAVHEMCINHKPQLALFMMPGKTMRIIGNSIMPRPDQMDKIDQLISQPAPSLSSTVTGVMQADVNVEVLRCIYLYGSTKHERLALVQPYAFTEDDPGSITLEDAFVSDCPNTLAGSKLIPVNSWFDDVQWGEIDFNSWTYPVGMRQ